MEHIEHPTVVESQADSLSRHLEKFQLTDVVRFSYPALTILVEYLKRSEEEKDIGELEPLVKYLLSTPTDVEASVQPNEFEYDGLSGSEDLVSLLKQANNEAVGKQIFCVLDCHPDDYTKPDDLVNTWQDGVNVNLLNKLLRADIFYFGETIEREGVSKRIAFYKVTFLSYLLLVNHSKLLVRLLVTEGVTLTNEIIKKSSSYYMSVLHLASLKVSTQTDNTQTDTDMKVIWCLLNLGDIAELLSDSGKPAHRTSPGDAVTSLALDIALMGQSWNLADMLIDRYEKAARTEFTQLLSDHYIYILLIKATTSLHWSYDGLRALIRRFQKRGPKRDALFHGLTRSHSGVAPHSSVLHQSLLNVADDRVYQTFINFLPPEMLKEELMAATRDGPCVLVTLAKHEKNDGRLVHTLEKGFVSKELFRQHFSADDEDHLHGEAVRESLSQDVVIVLNKFLKRFVVPGGQNKARKCALIYYNIKGREGSGEEDEHGHKCGCAKEEFFSVYHGLQDAGYKTIKPLPNWTRDSLIKRLREDLEEIKKQCSILVTFIMAHGTNDCVVDVDGKPVCIDDISHEITMAVPPEIPKILIVQACNKASIKIPIRIYETQPQDWRYFCRWSSVCKGGTCERNKFLPVLMEHWPKEDQQDFMEFVREVGDQLDMEYPDYKPPPVTHYTMFKKLTGF